MPYTFTHGAGTEADPYQVWTAADLNGVRDHLSAHFIQMADIDLSEYESWWPIDNPMEFSGVYDGNHASIKNLRIETLGTASIGLFYCVASGATIKNLNVTDADITISGNGGVIASINNGSIVGCSSSGLIKAMSGGIGGLVASNSGLIDRCFSSVSIIPLDSSSVNNGVGGLVGHATPTSRILNSYSKAEEIIGYFYVGGCVGTTKTVLSMSERYSRTAVTQLHSNDSRDASPNITNCYSASPITGNWRVGGILGHDMSGENRVFSCYYDSVTSGQSDTDKGTPKTTAEMKQQSTYEGWDFDTVWAIDPAINDGYPYLRRQVDESFQPWTAPKVEASWWEGFKLPFNVLELDDDAPVAINRNFKEIEHYINYLGQTSGEIRDSIELLATAPLGGGAISEGEWQEEEPEIPPTDSTFAGYMLGKEGQMGSIDASIKTDEFGGINEVWIARVIDRQGIVEIYDSDAPEHIFRTVAREFGLPIVNLGAEIVDVAIEFDGTYNQYGIFVSDAAPDLFWVERTSDEDIVYSVKWNGTGTPPEPIELARAYLGDLYGSSRDLDSSITV
jgi:hypothetical protein